MAAKIGEQDNTGDEEAGKRYRGEGEDEDGMGEESFEVDGDKEDARDEEGVEGGEDAYIPHGVGGDAGEGRCALGEQKRHHEAGGEERAEDREVKVAEVEEVGVHCGWDETQIPFGNDNQRSNGKYNSGFPAGITTNQAGFGLGGWELGADGEGSCENRPAGPCSEALVNPS